MIKIKTPTAELILKNNDIYNYLSEMSMDYEFMPYSDFDFYLTKRQIAELIDYILQDENRDSDIVETLTMTLTELIQQKQKKAEFHIVKSEIFYENHTDEDRTQQQETNK